MSEYIETSGSLIPSTHNTPTDPRTVIDSLSDVGNISAPYVGLIFYVKDKGKLYRITSVPSSGTPGYTEFAGSGNIKTIKLASTGKSYTPDSDGAVVIPGTSISSTLQGIRGVHLKLPGTYDSWESAKSAARDILGESRYSNFYGGEVLWQDKDGVWFAMEALGDDYDSKNSLTASTYLHKSDGTNVWKWHLIGSSSEEDYSGCTKYSGILGDTGESVSSGDSLVSPYIYIPKLTIVKFSGLTTEGKVWFYDSSYNPISGVTGDSGFYDYLGGVYPDSKTPHYLLPEGAQYVRYSHPQSVVSPGFSLVTRNRHLRDGYMVQDSYKKAMELKDSEVYHEVAEWTRPGLNPDAELLDQGSLKIINSKGAYLVDASSGTSVKVIGELQGNNWLRFKDTGAWAPVVVISQTQYDASSVALYTDTSATNLAFSAGSYNASTWWSTYGGAGLKDPTPLYDSSGNEVYCRRPWETVDKGYDIVVGWLKDIYIIGGELGRDGQEVYGFFEKPTYYSGILARKVDPTGGCPGLPTLISGKLRSVMCKSGAGTGGYTYPRYGLSGQAYTGISWFNKSGFAYPVCNVNQVSTMNYARAKNSDTTSNYPSCEGMAFHKLSRIYAAFVKYGTFNLNSYWGHGVSCNVGSTSSAWTAGETQFRIRTSSSSSTYYYTSIGDGYYTYTTTAASGKGVCLYNRTSASSSGSVNYDLRPTTITNYEYPKEYTLEAQMALSMAVECGIGPGTHFKWEGEEYYYTEPSLRAETLLTTTSLMSAKLTRVLPETTYQGFTSYNTSSASEAEYLLSGLMNLPVVDGEVWWGDVFDYGYGGLECVVDLQNNTSSGSKYTNPYKLYLCTHQEDLARETSIYTATGGAFDFEKSYELIGSGIRAGEGYHKSCWPYSIVPRDNPPSGATLTTGACAYACNYDLSGYFNYPAGCHARATMAGRGAAFWSIVSARYWYGYISASISYRYCAASLQIALA